MRECYRTCFAGSGLARTIAGTHPESFRGKRVGDFYVDLLVDEEMLVELKEARAMVPEHQSQKINYLNVTGIEVGLLINFGNPKLEVKPFTGSRERRPSSST